MKRLVLVAVSLAGCKGKPEKRAIASDAALARVADAGVIDAGPWPELANLPSVEPVRVIELPARPDVPRFTVGGPVLLGDLAIVSSSQFGFIAADFRRGQIAWTKAAGSHLAAPLVVDGNAVLIGDCINPPQVSESDRLLGCMRIVTPAGADQAYIAIRGKQKAVADFAGATGEERVWAAKKNVVWRRGEHAIAIDLMTGIAAPTTAEDPPLVVTYKQKTWQIRQDDEGVITAKGQPAWHTERSYGPLLGAVYLPEQAPMVRAASATRRSGKPEILLFDMDATGSLHGQVSLYPAPGIGIIGHAISVVGDVALAVRLDKTLQRDYIAGYAANALLIWTYALPYMVRPDPVGIAIASDAVVVFHDGDTLTILPEVSAPPTAPGAVRVPSENATP